MTGKRYSAGAIFLQVVPVFADVQRAIEDEAKTIDRALGDQMEKSGKEAGRRAGKAASEEMNKELKKGSGDFEREFHKSVDGINKALGGIETNKLGNGLRRELAQVKKEFEALKDLDLTAETDFKRAYADIAVLEGRLRGLRDDVKLVFRADIDNALKGLAKIAAAKEAIDDPVHIDVRVDSGPAVREMGAFEKAFKKSVDKAGSHLSGTMSKNVKRIQQDLRALHDLRIGIDIGANQAMRELAELEAELRVFASSSPEIDVKVETARALTELAVLKQAIDVVDGRDIDVKVDVDTGAAHRSLRQLIGGGDDAANSFRSFNAVILAAVSIGPALIPVLAGIAGGLIALGPAAAVGAAGIGSVLVGFSGLSDALGALSNRQDSQAKSAQSQANAQRSAAYAVVDAQQALADAQRNAGRAAADAAAAVAAARRAAADAIEAALERQKDAQEAYRDAVKEVAEAEKALREARRDAADDGEDLDRDIKGNQLAIDQAVLDAFDATNNLNAVMADGSSTAYDKEQARIQYEEAQLRLAELRDTQEDLAKQKKKWDKEGVDGTDAVQSAQDALTDALDRQKEALEGVRDAEEAVAEARADGARSVRAALEAQKEQAADSARSIADAREALRRAREDQARAAKEVTAQQQALNAAMDKLGPAGRKFVRFLWGLRDGFYAFRNDVQSVMLPAVQEAIAGFLDSENASVMRDALIGLAKGFGEFAKMLSTSLQGEAWGAFFKMIRDIGPEISASYGKGFISFLEAMASMLVAAGPLAVRFARGFANLMDSFADWAASKAGQEAMADFFGYIERIGPRVLDFVGAFVDAAANLLVALAPWGELVLTGLTDFLTFIGGMDPQLLGAIATSIIALVGASQLAYGAVTLLAQGMILFTSPVGAVIFAIAAIVAAIAILYVHNKDFRDFVQDAWKRIKDAIVDAWEELGPHLKTMGDALMELWDKILEPFVKWLGKFLIDYIIFWIPILAKWWGFLADAITIAVKIIIPLIEGIVWVIEKIVDAAVWLWDVLFGNSIFPDLVKGFKWWAGWVMKIFTWVADHWDEIVVAMKHVWETKLRPTWDRISIGARFLWNKVLKPVFTWIAEEWKKRLDAMNWVWEHVLKPIFDAIVDDAMPALKEAFRTTVDAIEKIWNTLKKIVGTPIYLVLETIINDGLIAGFNRVADFVHIDGIERIPNTDKIPHFAKGGVLPGYTPGRDVHDFYSPTGGRLALSGGEAIMRPEWTAAMGPDYVNYMNRIAASGGVAALRKILGGPGGQSERFATGGIYGGGALDKVYINGKAISRVAAAQAILAGRLIGATPYLMQGGYGGSNYGPSGTSHNYPGVGDWAPGTIAFETAMRKTGNAAWARNVPGRLSVGSGAHVHSVSLLDPRDRTSPQVYGSWKNHGTGLGGYNNDPAPHPPFLTNLLGKLKTVGLSDIEGLNTLKGIRTDPFAGFPDWIVDLAKDPLGYVKGLIEKPLDNFKDRFDSPYTSSLAKIPGALVEGVAHKVFDILPDGLQSAAKGLGKIFGSDDQVPDGTQGDGGGSYRLGGILPYNGTMKYDRGGYLPPGLTSVVNLTGRPEPVFTNGQLDELRSAGGGGITYAPVITEANLTSGELMDDFEFTYRKLRRRRGKYEGAM